MRETRFASDDTASILPACRLHTLSGAIDAVAVEQGALRMAAQLRRLAVAPGDRVLLRADSSPDHLTALLALMHLDASVVLLDSRETPAEVRRVAAISRARWVVAADECVLPGVSVLSLPELLTAQAGAEPAETLSFGAWLSRVDALVTWSRDADGRATGIVRSGPSVLAGIDGGRACMDQRPGDVLLPLVPSSDISGLTLFLISWAAGCSLALAPAAKGLEHAVRLAGRAGVTVVVSSPATYGELLDVIERQPGLLQDLRAVRAWRCGGAVAPALATRFEAVVGRPLLGCSSGPEPGAPGGGPHAPGSDTWVLHEDPLTDPDMDSRGRSAEIRHLLHAVREDPEILDRILRRCMDDSTTSVAAVSRTLADALDAELARMLAANPDARLVATTGAST